MNKRIWISIGLLLAFSDCMAADLFFAGDSTLHSRRYLESGDYPEEERCLGSWCDELECRLKPGVRIVNLARSGTSTKSFRDSGLWDKLIARVKPGDFVYIQFGHNDQKKDPKRHAAADGAFKDNLRRFAEEVRAKGGKPVFGTQLVRRFYCGAKDDRVADKLGKYPDAVRSLGKEIGVPVVDFNAFSRRLVESAGREESLKWYRAVLNKTDFTHLTRYGAKVMARGFYDEVKKGGYEIASLFLDRVEQETAADAPMAGISVFHWTIQELAKERGIPVSEACALFKAVGVDGFDCRYSDPRIEELVSSCLKPVNLFGHVKFRVKDKGEAQIRAFLEAAVRYRVPRVMVIPDHFSDGEPHENEVRDIVDGLRRFVAEAKKVGVTVTVETFGGKRNACSYAKYVKRFLDEVPGLCFALDTGNLHFAGRGDDIVDVAHHASNRIAHVHLKDWKKGVPPVGPAGERNYETVGLGAIPNEELVRYSHSVGFRGWYTLEKPLPGDVLGDTVRQIAVLRYWLAPPRLK